MSLESEHAKSSESHTDFFQSGGSRQYGAVAVVNSSFVEKLPMMRIHVNFIKHQK